MAPIDGRLAADLAAAELAALRTPLPVLTVAAGTVGRITVTHRRVTFTTVSGTVTIADPDLRAVAQLRALLTDPGVTLRIVSAHTCYGLWTVTVAVDIDGRPTATRVEVEGQALVAA